MFDSGNTIWHYTLLLFKRFAHGSLHFSTKTKPKPKKKKGIFLATFPVNEFENYVLPALSDPDAAKYLSGVGLQYAGVGMIKAIKEKNGALKLWETETPCGGGRARSCGNGPGTSNNSWAWGEGQWSYMRSYLESGASVYSQWNMVRVTTMTLLHPPWFSLYHPRDNTGSDSTKQLRQPLLSLSRARSLSFSLAIDFYSMYADVRCMN